MSASNRSVSTHNNSARAYIGALLGIRALENLPQHIDGCVRLDSNARQQSIVVDISNQLLRARLLIGRLFGGLRGGGERSFVVEAVQVAAGLLELLDPFLRLSLQTCVSSQLVEAFIPGGKNSLKLNGEPAIPCTSAIIMWQSNVPRPAGWAGFSTCGRTLATTGAPKVMFGTKWPSLCTTGQLSSGNTEATVLRASEVK